MTDWQGTVRDVATYNASTNVTTIANHKVYEAFGKVHSESGPTVDTAFGYTGRYFDDDAGLQWNLNRWYDPNVGRWLSEDPIGFAAGDPNLYRYVGNSVGSTIDSNGLAGDGYTGPTIQADTSSWWNRTKGWCYDVWNYDFVDPETGVGTRPTEGMVTSTVRRAIHQNIKPIGSGVVDAGKFVVVDVPLLIANLGNDAPLAGKVVEHLLHLTATVSPGATKGSTAPYTYAGLVLAETGDRQPRSLANAFRDPAKAQLTDATRRLATHLERLDAMYGAGETRRVAGIDPALSLPGTPAPMSLNELAKAVAAEVKGAV